MKNRLPYKQVIMWITKGGFKGCVFEFQSQLEEVKGIFINY